MDLNILNKLNLPEEVLNILKDNNVVIPETREELLELAMGTKENLTYDVCYDVEGKGIIREAVVTRCTNGIVVNYEDAYMRRRDSKSMVIGDDFPTDKDTYEKRFGEKFDNTRKQTFEWLKKQESLIMLPFYSGTVLKEKDSEYPSILILPKNSAFFALALLDLQGFIPKSEIPDSFKPKAIVYVAPPFRHTHFNGKQIVVHNRLSDIHEVFSYNLYPGPSAKKGIYGVLLNIGEKENWMILHAATVKIITPYDLVVTIAHEGASGGGKSEMLEPFHREDNGKVLLGTNTITGEEHLIDITDSCQICPVTDDMAECHPSIQNADNRLVVTDAENAWFLRVNHINKYGTEPATERRTIHPQEPLVFFNIKAIPNSTCLLWEPQMDSPNKPCSNPRVILPRRFVENCVDEPVEVDIRSFGIRQPPSTIDNPNYGIVGIFHVLPPALAWLWRLVAPRGFENPSILETSENIMESEGVGSYWPFATGKKVKQANLLLTQILNTLSTRYILVPNQHIGAYKVGFSSQWIAREYLSRRGGAKFEPKNLIPARCPILGYCLDNVKINGLQIYRGFIETNLQPELGNEGYDKGAKILTDFFKKEIESYLTDDLMPLGKKIIEACLNNASIQDYYDLIPKL